MYGRMQGGIAVHSAPRGRRFAAGPAAICLLALCALLGCGRGNAERIPVEPMGPDAATLAQRLRLHKAFAHVAPPQAYAALATLGALTPSNSAGHQSAVLIPHTFDANKQYSKAGKSGYIGLSADAQVTSGSPPVGHVDLNPPSSSFPGNFGYALYRVDGISQAVRTLKVTLGPSSGMVGVGVYNWAYGSNGRWEPRFFAAPSPQFDVALDDLPGADYIDFKGDLAFVVFCLRGSAVAIRGFELSDVSSNQPPFANVFATICSTPAPLVTELDAHNSSDDGTIVKYRFDPEGHNQWIDNGANPVLQYIYSEPGPYIPRVEVTDNLGLTSRAAADAVICEPASFDEVEDNDSFATAQDLPATPFSLFSGNVGVDGPNNGDAYDYFKFNASTGDKVAFQAYYCRMPGSDEFNIGLGLYDSDDQVMTIAQGFYNWLPATLQYTIKDTDVPPFYLLVYNGTGFSYSYFLGTLQDYSETEDNDAAESAQLLNNLVVLQQFDNWNGSLGLGSDYQGNDGDDDDWYYFTAASGMTVNLDLDYNSATGNLGATLFNAFGEAIANSADDDGNEHISYTFQQGDPNPIMLHLAALGGTYSDYTLSGTMDTPNPGFDEQEDNEDTADANVLPAFPFSSFTGNVGRGGQYDQDWSDLFKFNPASGDLVRFTVAPVVQGSTTLLVKVSDTGDPPDPPFSYEPTAEDEATGVLLIPFVVKANANPPFYLNLQNYSYTEPVDYVISGEVVTSYDEVEDNDLRPQATQLPQEAQFAFAGSMGAGGYDGDLVDWLTFSADIGEQPVFYLLYDDSTLSFDMQADPPSIEDEAGDVVAAGVVDSDSKAIRLTFQKPIDINDISPFYIKINGKTGASNYWLQRTK